MKNGKRYFFFGSLTVIGLGVFCEILSKLILISFVEPLVRVPYTSTSPTMPFRSETLWSMRKNDSYDIGGNRYETNADGLRGMPFQPEYSKNILAIGDSSTFGFGVGVTESYLGQLGECAEMNTLNGGVPGFSSEQSRVQLSSLLSKNEVNWLVIANLWSDMMSAGQSDRDRLEAAQHLVSRNRIVASTLHEYSSTFRLLTALLLRGIPVNTVPIDAILSAKDNGEVRRVSPDRYFENLQFMVDRAHDANVQVVILLLPTNRSGPHPTAFEQRPYRSYADMVAADKGVEIIDMDIVYEPLPAQSLKNRFIDLVHPGALGHADIASELCEIMRDDKD